MFLVSANPCDVAIFMGKCEKALFQATFGHKIKTLMLIASVSKLAFLYGGEGETRTPAPVTRPTPLAGAPRHQLEYFSMVTYFVIKRWRREWDSNPRYLSVRRFSRPFRYNHFGISPYCASGMLSYSHTIVKVFSLVLIWFCRFVSSKSDFH